MADLKRIQNVKKILPFVEKTLCIRCVLIAYVYHTLYPSSNQTLISSALKVLNCTKRFELMGSPPFTTSVCNTYEQQTVHIRYHSLNSAVSLFVLFHFVFTNFWQFCRFFGAEKNRRHFPQNCSSAVSFSHTFCVSFSGTGPQSI